MGRFRTVKSDTVQ